MKKYVFALICCVAFRSALSHDNLVTGWDERPRITLFEKLVTVGIQSVGVSIGAHLIGVDSSKIKMPKWMVHALTPTAGAVTIAPTIIKGLHFKNKLEVLQQETMYDRSDLLDPLLYVTCFAHPFDPSIKLVSGAGLYKAYQQVDASLQPDFAHGLLATLDYSTVEWGLRAVVEAKKHIEYKLQDLKYYSDIEERLRRIIYFSLHSVGVRADQLPISPEVLPDVLEPLVQDIIDSGTYCQPVMINTVTKSAKIKEVSPWYEDDFVYYYASWYGFELIKAYCRLLALEQIWTSLLPAQPAQPAQPNQPNK